MFSLRGGVGFLRSCVSNTNSSLFLRQNTLSTRTYASITKAKSKSEPDTSLAASLNRTSHLFKTYKPVSPGIRHLRRPINDHIYEGRPIRALTLALRKNGGRNNHGRITVRHRGGGHRRRIRIVDFTRNDSGICDVVRIEYDPGRSAHIALLKSRETGKWSYVLATEGMRAGDEVQSFRQGIPPGFIPGFDDADALKSATELASEDSTSNAAEDQGSKSAEMLAVGLLRTLTLKPGNVLPIRLIPTGTVVHNICLKPDGPGLLVRSAGSFGQVVLNKAGERYAHIRLQSGEVRKVLQECCATIGKVSNPLWKNRSLGKAGRARWLGRRPSVRGVAMNANDHPHGGGRGKSKSNKHPVSIWGWGTKGTRTRKPGPKGPKNSNKMVIKERPRGKEKRMN